MLAFFGLETSRSFWRLVYPTNRAPSIATYAPPLAQCAYALNDVRELRPEWATDKLLALDDDKLHVLVFERSQRRTSKTHQARCWSYPVPDGSFLDLGQGSYVCSPEFAFLLTSASHNIIDTISYGNELCGTYSFDPFNERGMRQRKPLTTPAKLAKYIESAQGCRGAAQAKRALRHMTANAASPMEATIQMLLCLPRQFGGYGIPRPVMNCPIELESEAAQLARKSVCYADIYWKDVKIDLEYQGHFDHSGQIAFDADRARVNGLRHSSVEVIELTNGLVKDPGAFDTIARHLAKRLHKRLPEPDAKFSERRMSLRKELFTWNRAGGRRPS